METLEKVAVIAILLVGGGTVLFFLPLPLPPFGESEPEFRVFDFQVIGNSISMLVENTGSGDAHNIGIDVYGNFSGGWLHLNPYDTSGPSELRAGYKQLVVLSASEPLGYDEYKVVVSCDEGATYELVIGFGS
jgi:hypothetical protein